MPPEEFSRLLRDSPNPAVDTGGAREAYRYAKVSSVGLGFCRKVDGFDIVTEIRDALTTRLS